MGADVFEALKYEDFLTYVEIYDIDIPTDKRTPEEFTAFNYVVSEPYILDGLEFGWDSVSEEFAHRIYQVQQKRFRETGIITAVSEDHIDKAPYFVYNTIFADGKTWNCITDKGADASDFKNLSTKAAMGWHVLFSDDYSGRLSSAIAGLYDENKGWYSGRYENTGGINGAITCNTNGIILEALCFRCFGQQLKLFSERDN